MPQQQKYLTDADNTASLVAEMDPRDRADYESFGHNRIESAFVDRVFVLYEATGRHTAQQIQRAPRVITTIRVVGFHADYVEGCKVRLLDESTQSALIVGHVPQRLFDYPIFVQVPPRMTIKWDSQYLGERLIRSLLFTILVKARNKAEFFSKGNIYLETPNNLRDALYPHLGLDLNM